jgi:hypothetical protein
MFFTDSCYKTHPPQPVWDERPPCQQPTLCAVVSYSHIQLPAGSGTLQMAFVWRELCMHSLHDIQALIMFPIYRCNVWCYKILGLHIQILLIDFYSVLQEYVAKENILNQEVGSKGRAGENCITKSFIIAASLFLLNM